MDTENLSSSDRVHVTNKMQLSKLWNMCCFKVVVTTHFMSLDDSRPVISQMFEMKGVNWNQKGVVDRHIWLACCKILFSVPACAQFENLQQLRSFIGTDTFGWVMLAYIAWCYVLQEWIIQQIWKTKHLQGDSDIWQTWIRCQRTSRQTSTKWHLPVMLFA